jgi:hypothetical protein
VFITGSGSYSTSLTPVSQPEMGKKAELPAQGARDSIGEKGILLCCKSNGRDRLNKLFFTQGGHNTWTGSKGKVC